MVPEPLGGTVSWASLGLSWLLPASSPSPSLRVPITPSPEQFGGLRGVRATMNFQKVPQQAEKTSVAEEQAGERGGESDALLSASFPGRPFVSAGGFLLIRLQ